MTASNFHTICASSLPSGWVLAPVGAYCSVIDPQPDHRAPALDPDGLPYIGIRDVNDDGTVNESTARMVSEKAVLKQEKAFTISDKDIVFCKVGTLGQPRHLNIEKKRVALSATLVLIKAKENCCERYLKHVLDSDYLNSQIYSVITGATRPALGIQQIRKFKLPFPPLMVQLQISRFLDRKTDKLDEAISIKEKQIELLRERKQIIIQQAVTQGLNSNAPMKDSGVDWIGDIPEHWEIKRLKYVLDERNERSKTGEEPLFMMSQVHGLVVRADFHDKAEVAASNVDNKIVYKNDLVFNKLKAHLGVFFKSNIDMEGLVSPDYAVYKPKAFISDLKLLEILFRNPKYIEQFIIRATGIVEGLIRLYTDDLFDISVPVAPESEQHEILKFIDIESQKFDRAIQIQSQQIEKLKEYKTTLINSAVTGKIKVPSVA